MAPEAIVGLCLHSGDVKCYNLSVRFGEKNTE